MTPDTNRVFRLAQRPRGKPDHSTFDLVEDDVPSPADGEVLVRTCYLSVDPYMRDRMSTQDSYAEPWDVGDPLRGNVVGEVVDSNTEQYDDGDLVTGELLWADYAVADPENLLPVQPEIAPISTALGVLGLTGLTAYFGIREVAQPLEGETVVVSGAAGAVGSVAGQIAQIDGARVVGIAGSEAKVDWLDADLGFDATINYTETDNYEAALADAAPEGVDVYFDNVGGPITDAVFTQLNVGARVAVCGQISQYNATEQPMGPRKLSTLVVKRARVEGFLVTDFEDQWEAAIGRLAHWVTSEKLQYRETVTEGLEDAPDAFLGLFEGQNIGKQVVKVADYDG